MIRRGLTIISGASLLLCVATAGLWIWSDCAKTAPGTTSRLMPDGYPLGHGIRILADDGEISLYNQSPPYHGSIIGIARAGSPSPWPREIGFDFIGIYFRHFTWPAVFPGGTYWTLTVSLAWPLILMAALPLAWAGLRMRRAGRRKPGSCPACGYDLRASINRCPECGTPIAPNVAGDRMTDGMRTVRDGAEKARASRCFRSSRPLRRSHGRTPEGAHTCFLRRGVSLSPFRPQVGRSASHD